MGCSGGKSISTSYEQNTINQNDNKLKQNNLSSDIQNNNNISDINNIINEENDLINNLTPQKSSPLIIPSNNNLNTENTNTNSTNNLNINKEPENKKQIIKEHFEGNLVNNKKEGKGKYYYQNGDIYDGVTDINLKVILKTEKKKEKEFFFIKTEINMNVNIKMI